MLNLDKNVFWTNMLQVSMKERNNFNVIFVMLSLDRRVLAHCRGRVTKKNEIFCESDCQNPKILAISCTISKNQKVLTMFFWEIENDHGSLCKPYIYALFKWSQNYCKRDSPLLMKLLIIWTGFCQTGF